MSHYDIEIESLTKHYGPIAVLRDVSLQVRPGEVLALLGPSGCGKTTTLRVVAGFVAPDAGRVRIRGRDVTRTPAYQRNTGMVFQNYALFPHLTVRDNVAFGLSLRRQPPAEIERRVAEALRLVRLGGLEKRYP
ncbi:MAG: ABC transporter ATP-binding protein, partial [Armatimonadetes bacterium]|nr:ABC transporter ATP-binding protein [Armatimonadota bacterium]